MTTEHLEIGTVYKYECSREEWQAFIEAMGSGHKFEVDEENWYYWLEVLPPVFMGEAIDYFPGREGQPTPVSFGFAEGTEPITVFWKWQGRYYGQRTKRINRLS